MSIANLLDPQYIANLDENKIINIFSMEILNWILRLTNNYSQWLSPS